MGRTNRAFWAGVALIGGLGCGEDTPADDDSVIDASLESDAFRREDGGEVEPVDLGPPPPPSEVGCEGDARLASPADPSEPGPWPVGAATATVGRLTVEVWYPAEPGSETGVPNEVYDIREALPPMERVKIDDAANPPQPCDCARGLPLDTDHGPYPVVLFVHGTAGFRTQSLTTMTHWASRGFVVVAADHPGLWLYDNLARFCPDPATGSQDIGADADAMLAALASPSGELAFLEGAIDLERIAVTGHSAGGGAAASLANRSGVRAVIPMASNGAVETDGLGGILFLAGSADGVVRAGTTRRAFDGSPSPKRYVLLDNAGHLAFSDICVLENDAGQNLLETAEAAGVCGANLAGFLFDCSDDQLDASVGQRIVSYATTALLEEVLLCRGEPDPFDTLEATFPDVSELASE